jgi:hypothetical protein
MASLFLCRFFRKDVSMPTAYEQAIRLFRLLLMIADKLTKSHLVYPIH